jgi:hypothetical protein
MYTIHTSADLPQILTVPSDLSIQIPRCCLCTAWQTTSHVMAELASLRHSCCYIPYCLAASGSYISQSGLPAAIGTRLACRSLSYDHGCECVLISATHVNFSESEISRSITWQFPYQRPLWCPRIIFRTHFLNDAHYLHLNSKRFDVNNATVTQSWRKVYSRKGIFLKAPIFPLQYSE